MGVGLPQEFRRGIKARADGAMANFNITRERTLDVSQDRPQHSCYLLQTICPVRESGERNSKAA